MNRINQAGVAGVLAVLSVARVGHAQEPAPPSALYGNASAAPAAATAVANGLMVQARMQTQTGLLSIGGGPGFLVGYQGAGFAVGLGLGITRLGVSTSQGGDTSASVTLFQLVPTALIDVWHSTDGRARANVVGGLGYGRASFDATTQSQSCVVAGTGNETCTTTSDKVGASATLIPIMIGLGGDYFFSRNFALGAEGGVQGAFVTGVQSTSNGTSSSIDAHGDMQFAYGVIRATLVLGN